MTEQSMFFSKDIKVALDRWDTSS